MKELKVLCFTTSYKRHKMLRGVIFDIKNQSYKNIHHTINIASDNDNKVDYSLLYDDIDDITLTYNNNSKQHFNYLNAIIATNYDNYDLFIKIDDDEIYKRNYVANIVNFFNNHPDVDVTSSKIKYQLNGSSLNIVNRNNLGSNKESDLLKMGSTLAFNAKALKYIFALSRVSPPKNKWEDSVWCEEWKKYCNVGEVANESNVIWYVHGNNSSTNYLFKG